MKRKSKNTALVKCIRGIISSARYRKGHIFDTHDIIRELIVNHRSDYDANNAGNTPRSYNAHIGQIISGLDDLVKREMPDHKSPNCTPTCLYGNATPCARWRRK